MRKLILITMMLSLVAGLAVAKELHPKSAPHGVTTYEASRDVAMEGFEGPVFPPTGWTLTTTVPANTWGQLDSAYEGLYGAHVAYTATETQDELLTFDAAIEADDYLVFATMGSPYWSTNGVLTVEVDGTEVFNYLTDNQGGTFVWELYNIDLSPTRATP